MTGIHLDGCVPISVLHRAALTRSYLLRIKLDRLEPHVVSYRGICEGSYEASIASSGSFSDLLGSRMLFLP